ncbi:cyclodeaminase/cyclohydrolase family protein [Naasia lichenicola]|uniref:Cyclodeaminase/cyclohydrolase family protein n=1 Tax=Naasia lichenicola TaxID=2565933 RepID=A0A4V6RZ03_9MICO|nr:cyclodeaminase/cyclohydrolase family protein [Naasia lichenicola]THG29947.1 cyclodeaminase/cyclohydrolase family protein [Naasia lichenicola]
MTEPAAEHLSSEDRALGEWLAGLARSTGSPGGGAAAAIMLAIAAGLTSMVAGYSRVEDGVLAARLADLTSRASARREDAVRLADEDAAGSKAFGAAFSLPDGAERIDAIRSASVVAAQSSRALGEAALEAIEDLEWLAEHGNRALVADVAVACGAIRAAITGARTNVSFDLASARSAGRTLDDVRADQPELWAAVTRFDEGIRRIDALAARIDGRAAPTDHHGG